MKTKTVKRNSLFHIILIAFLLTVSAAPVSAQRVLKLKDAIDTAMKNYPELKAKAFFTQSAEQGLKESRREYIPALKLHEQLSYATANSVTGTFFPYGVVLPVAGGILPQNYSDAAYGSVSLAYFEWPFFSFGQYRAKNQIAASQLAYARADEDNEKFQLKIQAADAYLNLVALQKLEKSFQDNLKRAQTIQRLVRVSAINGLKPGVDSSFANAEVAKAQIALLDIQKNVYTQNAVLYTILGNRLQNAQLDTNFLSNVPSDVVSNDSTTISNPILNLYSTNVDISRHKEDYIQRAYLPKIALLGGAWGRGSGINGDDPTLSDKSFSGGISMTRFNYAVGIAATFNIADYPRMHAEASAERYKTKALMQEEEQEKTDLQNQLIASEQTLQLALQQAKVAPVQLKAASDAYTQKLTLYNNGLTPLSDLTQALYNFNKAEADLAVTNNTAWRALLYKASIKGDLTSFMNQLP